MKFSRPCGTHANINDDPALKRRAILPGCPVGTNAGAGRPPARLLTGRPFLAGDLGEIHLTDVIIVVTYLPTV